MEDKRSFVIIDGSHLLHRTISVPEILEMNVDGLVTGGFYSFLRSLEKTVKMFKLFPVVVFDKGLSKRRLELFSDYKNAKSMAAASELPQKPEWLILKETHLSLYRNQRSFVMEALKYLGVPTLLIEGWEGDDLIYYLSKNYDCPLVMSEDKDLLQLLNFSDLYMPIKMHYYVLRESDSPRINISYYNTIIRLSLEKQYGMKDISQFLSYKSMLGDPSDNISGVNGIGEKNAKKISMKIQSDPEFINKLLKDEIRPETKFEEKLKNQIESYRLSMKLIDLSEIKFSSEISELVNKIMFFSRGDKVQDSNYRNFLNRYNFSSLKEGVGGFCHLLEMLRNGSEDEL